VHEDNPFRGGGWLTHEDGPRQRWGSVCIQGDDGYVVSEKRPCAHTGGAVPGACGSGSTTRSAGVSMDAK